MDFIETWFGIVPDGGDGSLETAWVVAIVFAIGIIGFRRQILARLKRPVEDKS